jgi:hypothetical protein
MTSAPSKDADDVMVVIPQIQWGEMPPCVECGVPTVMSGLFACPEGHGAVHTPDDQGVLPCFECGLPMVPIHKCPNGHGAIPAIVARIPVY